MQGEPFDLVLSGSVWHAGELIQAPLRAAVLAAAPQARFVLPSRTPATGAGAPGLGGGSPWHSEMTPAD